MTDHMRSVHPSGTPAPTTVSGAVFLLLLITEGNGFGLFRKTTRGRVG
ncbi:hypothetical protein [Streptomyces vinaceus]